MVIAIAILVFLNRAIQGSWESRTIPMAKLRRNVLRGSCGGRPKIASKRLCIMRRVKERTTHVRPPAWWTWSREPADLACSGQYVKALPVGPGGQRLKGVRTEWISRGGWAPGTSPVRCCHYGGLFPTLTWNSTQWTAMKYLAPVEYSISLYFESNFSSVLEKWVSTACILTFIEKFRAVQLLCRFGRESYSISPNSTRSWPFPFVTLDNLSWTFRGGLKACRNSVSPCIKRE